MSHTKPVFFSFLSSFSLFLPLDSDDGDLVSGSGSGEDPEEVNNECPDDEEGCDGRNYNRPPDGHPSSESTNKENENIGGNAINPFVSSSTASPNGFVSSKSLTTKSPVVILYSNSSARLDSLGFSAIIIVSSLFACQLLFSLP